MFKMKPFCSVLLFAGLLSSTALFAENLPEKDLINLYADSFNYVDQHASEIWPEYSLPGLATIIGFNADGSFDETKEHLYAFDFKPHNPAWQKIELQGRRAYYMPQNPYKLGFFDVTKVDDQPVLFMFASDGRNAVDGNLSFNNTMKFMHFVINHFKISDDIYKGSEDFAHNENNLRLASLELEATSAYLKNNDIDALKDMIAIRQYRSKGLSVSTRNFENAQEQMLGMSFYGGIKSSHYDINRENAVVLAEILNNKPKLENTDYMFLDDFTNYIESSLGEYSGATIGLALERSGDKQWKNAVQNNTAAPIDLLIKHYPMNETEISQRVNNATEKYHFNEFANTMSRLLKENDAGLDALQKKFDASQDIKVELTISLLNDSDSKNEYSYQHTYKVSTNANAYDTVKKTWQSKSVDLNIQFIDLPALFESELTKDFKILPDYRFQTTNEFAELFKLPANARIIIDGKETTLGQLTQSDQTIPFSQLSIEHAQANVTIGKGFSGELVTEKGTLRVKAVSAT